MSRGKVTPINMLPELEDLESSNMGGSPYQPSTQTGSAYATNNTYPGAALIPKEEAERVGRFIRGGHMAPSEAGMMPRNNAPSVSYQEPAEVEQYTPQNSNGLKLFNMPDNSPSCLNVAEHIANCPICSKFYNNDRTVYVIAIVILIIICILLLKKVLEV
jgi:hypothetical protein